MTETAMSKERKIVFILDDYVKASFAGLVLNAKSERQIRRQNDFDNLSGALGGSALANRSEYHHH